PTYSDPAIKQELSSLKDSVAALVSTVSTLTAMMQQMIQSALPSTSQAVTPTLISTEATPSSSANNFVSSDIDFVNSDGEPKDFVSTLIATRHEQIIQPTTMKTKASSEHDETQTKRIKQT